MSDKLSIVTLFADYECIGLERVKSDLPIEEQSYLASFESPSNPDVIMMTVELGPDAIDKYDLRMWNRDKSKD